MPEAKYKKVKLNIHEYSRLETVPAPVGDGEVQTARQPYIQKFKKIKDQDDEPILPKSGEVVRVKYMQGDEFEVPEKLADNKKLFTAAKAATKKATVKKDASKT